MENPVIDFDLSECIEELDEGRYVPFDKVQDLISRLKFEFCTCKGAFFNGECSFCKRINKLTGEGFIE